MKKALIVISMLSFAAAGSTACATKGYVRNQVGQVSSKVDTLSQALEQTQERTRANETKITRSGHQGRRGAEHCRSRGHGGRRGRHQGHRGQRRGPFGHDQDRSGREVDEPRRCSRSS